MSDPDDARDWRLYVEDMLDFGQRVATYAHGMDQEAFIADGRTYDATLRNIELIGEAATHDVPELLAALRRLLEQERA